MAWKFVQEFSQDGDVVEPSEWRINNNEMFSELNGFLDSDNIGRQVINNSMVARNAFTEVIGSDLSPSRSYVFAHEESGWITHGSSVSEPSSNMRDMAIHPGSLDASGLTKHNYLQALDNRYEKLPSVTFKPDQDGLLICEFSGWASWMNQSTNSADMARHDSDYSPSYTEVRTSGFKTNNNHMLYGFFAQQSKNFKHLSSYVLCSLWRLTVNGQVVAETGPLGNDYQAHPIYLCGTTPITKGTETIVQLEAQFVWYSHGSEQTLSSSSFNPLEAGLRASRTPFSYRLDCSLNCPTLIVTHRKR